MTRQPVTMVAAGYLVLLLFVAAFATQLTPYDPDAGDLQALLQGPSSDHLLGTDQLGRDTLSRLLVATQIAVIAGVEAIVVALGLGVPIGLISGYVGGRVDRAVMRMVDVLLSLPGMVVALAIIAAMGPGLVNAMFAVGVLFAIRIIRLVRGTVLSAREELYVSAARLSGAPPRRVILRYILPNVSIPLLVEVALYFGVALLIEAMLSFLGVGVQPPQATWGTMLSEARSYVGEQPFLPVPAGVMITLTVLAFNLVADGLSAALDPREKRRVLPLPDAPTDASSADEADGQAVLAVRALRVRLPGGDGGLDVLRGVSFDVHRGEIVGLVGESGSGKSLTALSCLGLLPPRAEVRGSIRLLGEELVGRPEKELQAVRGRKLAMVFQEPAKALNPSLTVGRQIAEGLEIHRGLSRREALWESAELLRKVGVPNAEKRLREYPHQFSGGMAQRVVIAMALACDPDVLIADEPTTALDVTTQGQVLDLLLDLREQTGVAILLITHDLGVVADLCDRANVMYAGEVVESAGVQELFDRPQHPYTTALLRATPDDQAEVDRLASIPGQVPRPDELTGGCAFAGRCAHRLNLCSEAHPRMIDAGGGVEVRCHLHEVELATSVAGPGSRTRPRIKESHDDR